RVATQTEFNGLKVLDGSFTAQVFQVGANFGQTISVNAIQAATAEALGLNGGTLQVYAMEGDDPVTGALAEGELVINGVAVGEADADASAIAAAIRAANTGVEVEAINVVTTEFDNVSGTQAGETY